jgi:hypothetical protein
MVKKIELEWPDQKIVVKATLLEKEEPEFAELLWNDLEKEMKTYCSHTLSTGEVYLCFARPPKKPMNTGSQRAPVGRIITLMTRMENGQICYGGGGGLRICYGRITEPLPAGAPIVAIVDKKDLEKNIQAGKAVWQAQYLTHKLVTVLVRRVSD